MRPDVKSLNNELTPKAWSAMVYIRPVLVSDLSADLQREAEGIETLYSVHSPDGARVALSCSRRTTIETPASRATTCTMTSAHPLSPLPSPTSV